MEIERKKIITTTIVVAFSLLISLFFAESMFFRKQIESISNLTHKLYDQPLTVSNKSIECSLTITKIHRSMKDIVLFPETINVVSKIEEVNTLEEKVYSDLGIIREKILGEKGTQLINEAYILFKQWKPIRDDVIFRVVQKDLEYAALVTKEDGAEHVAKMESKMFELNQYARNKAADFLNQTIIEESKIKKISRNLLIAGTLLSLIVGIFTITIALKSENKLIQNEHRHRIIFKNSPLGLIRFSAEGKIINLNQKFADLMGSSKDKLLSFNTAEKSSFSMRSALKKALKGKKSLYEDKYTVTGGRTIDMRVMFNPVDPGAESTEVIAALEDITDRKKTEKALQENEKRLNTIFQSVQSGIMLVDAETHKVIDINPTALKMLEATKESVVGHECHGHVCPAEKGECPITDLGKEVDNSERALITTRGEKISILKTVTQITINDRPCLLECFVDISQQKKVEEQLLAAKNAAEEATRSKAAFLSNMSHEIRTPMNGVIGMTELLRGTELDSEQQDYVNTVQVSGESLMTIINDILDYSKIEAGKVELDSIKFSLRKVLEDIADLSALKIQEKSLEYCTIIHPSVPLFFIGDPGRLRQIFINLIGNALKFTEKGEIVVSAKVIEENDKEFKLHFSVRDTGIGIPANKKDMLFESFSQVDASTTRKYGGTGLGLTISKELSKLMGGMISVDSEEGKGSTFSFTAVLQKLSSSQEKEKIIKQDIKDKRILIVDDNKTNRFVLREDLKLWRCRYDEAENGTKALEKLKRGADEKDPFDIAIVDMQMPGMDGETLGAKIRNSPDLCITKLVMLTSVGARGDVQRLGKIGFSAYLNKPVKQSNLYDCLTSIDHDNNKEDKDEPAKIITQHTIAESHDPGARILLAEDNFINQKVALGALKKIGILADAVSNGVEALEALEKIKYDIVLMDCQMPEMDGYQATGEIRNKNSKVLNHDIPIIALTANAMQEDREKCMNAGMSDYLTKPVKRHDLSQMLKKWLKLKK